MAEEQVAALVERLQADEDLANAIGAAQTAADAAQIATDAGFVVTADEIDALTTGSNRDLSDAELETASGGTGSSVYVCLPTQVLCTIRWICG